MSYSIFNVEMLSEIYSPPDTVDGRKLILTAFYLAALLVVGVPVIALTSGIPLLALVGAGGVCYLLILIGTDSLFEGVCSAIIVLTTFAADVPLHRIPVGSDIFIVLDVMLVDVVLVPFVALVGMWVLSGDMERPSLSSLPLYQKLAVYALFGFVLWSFLAAVVANGPSRGAALAFVVTQVRHALLFVAAIAIVRFAGLYTAVYSLLIAVCFQLSFAVVQTLNHAWFGLSYLGEANGIRQGLIHIGPIAFMTGQYAGGFTGTPRILVAVLLLLAPVLVEIIVNRALHWKVLATVALFSSALLVRVSGSDAGFAAFALVMALVAIVVGYLGGRTLFNEEITAARDSILGFGSSVGAGASNIVLFTMRESVEDDPIPDNSGASGGSDWSSGPEVGHLIDEARIIELLGYVPLISISNTSVRIKQYLGAVDIGLQHPLFGIGGFNFLWMATSYGVSEPKFVHNIYLAMLASTGFPGALLFVTSLLAVLVCVGRHALKSSRTQLLWAALACGVVSFYAYSFWVAIHSTGSVALMVFWTVAGFGVGANYE